MSNDVKKALTAGYSEGGTAPEKIEEVHTGPALTQPKPAEAAPAAPAPVAEAPKTEPVAAAPAPTPAPEAPKAKIPAGLFQPFSLGSTIAPNPNGGSNVNNMKKPMMDYVSVEQKATKNIRMTAEDFKPKK